MFTKLNLPFSSKMNDCPKLLDHKSNKRKRKIPLKIYNYRPKQVINKLTSLYEYARNKQVYITKI